MPKMTILVPGVVLLTLLTTGCGSKQSAEDKKLAEMQKQLDDTRKQLEESKSAQPAGQPPAAASTAATGARQGAAGPSGTAGSSVPNPAPPTESAAARADLKPATPAPPPPPPPPKVITIPSGTPVPVVTVSALSTKTSNSGEVFQATLQQDLVVDGTVIARRGADVTGVVVAADPGGKVKGVASLDVALRSLKAVNGERLQIHTSNYTALAKKSVKKDVVRGGIMSGAGAAIGAIAGGGKGAAIGAGVGAGAGVGTAMMTKGEPAVIPSGTALTFKLSAPASVTLKPGTAN